MHGNMLTACCHSSAAHRGEKTALIVFLEGSQSFSIPLGKTRAWGVGGGGVRVVNAPTALIECRANEEGMSRTGLWRIIKSLLRK